MRLDAFAAYGVGVLAAATVLLLFGVVESGMSADAIIRTITIQAAPAGFGAMVAHLEVDEPAARIGPGHPHGFASSAFLMAVGALYLCSSLASTEEMMLIAYKMSVWQIGGLMVFSLVMMQLFDEYAIEEDLGERGRPIGVVRITGDDVHRLHHRPVDQPLYPLDVRPNRRADVRPAREGNDRAWVSGRFRRWRRAAAVLRHGPEEEGGCAALPTDHLARGIGHAVRAGIVRHAVTRIVYRRPASRRDQRPGRRDSSVGARLPRQSQDRQFGQRHGRGAGR